MSGELRGVCLGAVLAIVTRLYGYDYGYDLCLESTLVFIRKMGYKKRWLL